MGYIQERGPKYDLQFYLGRHKIVSGDNRISINVLENPKYALIDPYVRLIDKELENNYQAF